MSFLLAAVSTIAATPVPSPVPSPTPIVQVVQQIKEVPVTPEYINQLVLVGLLGLAGFVGSWIQSFINARKTLGEKVNVLVTTFYTIAGAAVVMYQQGQLDLDNLTPLKAISAAAIVLMAAWVRFNSQKLTKVSTPAQEVPATSKGTAAAVAEVLRRATT